MSDENPLPPARRDPLAALRRTSTVAARCQAVAGSIADGRSGDFRLDATHWPALVDRLARAEPGTAAQGLAPRGNRWAALRAGGIDRGARLLATVPGEGADADAARLDAAFDLAVLLVLTDSQAADAWHFDEPADAGGGAPAAIDPLALPVERHASEDLFALLDRFAPGAAPAASPSASPSASGAPATGPAGGAETGATADSAPTAAPTAAPASPSSTSPSPLHPAAGFTGAASPTRWTGSTALAIATARAVAAGMFSSRRDAPVQADAGALRRVDAASLRAALQTGAANALPGVEARAAALARLGQRLGEEAARDGGLARPARWVRQAMALAAAPEDPRRLDAARLAAALARRFAGVTAGGATVLGLPAGEVCPHLWAGSAAGQDDSADAPLGPDAGTAGSVPFHTATLSLVRSLVEPLAAAGYALDGLDRLPDSGAARHVALLLETGVLRPRSAAWNERTRPVGDGAVVEARAAAVALLPRAAAEARALRQARGETAVPTAEALIDAACPPLARSAAVLRVDGESGLW